MGTDNNVVRSRGRGCGLDRGGQSGGRGGARIRDICNSVENINKIKKGEKRVMDE